MLHIYEPYCRKMPLHIILNKPLNHSQQNEQLKRHFDPDSLHSVQPETQYHCIKLQLISKIQPTQAVLNN
jgi:hypothetical protein